MKGLLCVGGPMDGKWVTIKDNTFEFIAAVQELAPTTPDYTNMGKIVPTKKAVYTRVKIYNSNGSTGWNAEPFGEVPEVLFYKDTEKSAVEMLIDNYQRCV